MSDLLQDQYDQQELDRQSDRIEDAFSMYAVTSLMNTAVPLLWFFFVYSGEFKFDTWFDVAWNVQMYVHEFIWGILFLLLPFAIIWSHSETVAWIFVMWSNVGLAGPFALYAGVLTMFVLSLVLEETWMGMSIEAMITYTSFYAFMAFSASLVQFEYLPDLKQWYARTMIASIEEEELGEQEDETEIKENTF